MRPDPPPANFQVEHHFPELTRLANAVRSEDWSTVEAIFADLTDPDDHVFAALMVGGMDGSEELLRKHTEAGDAPLARTLYGIRLVVQAWDIRTGARAQYVSRKQFRGFHEYLARAEATLLDATARDPDDLTAWTERIVTARGLEFGQSEARRRYDQVARRAPHMLAAQQQLLQKLCPKWSGTFEAAEAFVRERIAAAPEGSPVPALMINYHAERCLDLNLADTKRYMSQPAVRGDILAAAERSVDSPRFRPGLHRYQVHNLFACAFGLMGDYRAAARQFEAIGPHGYKPAWQYLGNPETVFAEQRATALAKG